MKAGGTIIRLMALESIAGPMDVSMKGSGRRTTCMVEASTPGVMEDDMMVNTSATKSMDLGPIAGLMVALTPEVGKMASNTAMALTVSMVK